MKRITAVRNACLAAAGIVATAALAWGVAYVAFPPARHVAAYRDPGVQPPPPQPPPPDQSAVWKTRLGATVDPTPAPPPLDLVGTTCFADRGASFAVVNTPAGQHLLRTGDRLLGGRLTSVEPGTATLTFYGKPVPLNIERFTK